MFKYIIFLLSTFLYNIHSFGQIEELGRIRWNRTLEEGLCQAKEQKKPILILFQEVPGCRTCKNYGNNVLSHPLIVETIEEYFIPVCIFNNRGGKDKETLEFFKEPAWNNPVVRIIDQNNKPIVDRLSGNYTVFGLISLIESTLIRLNINIPQYLSLLKEEHYAEEVGVEKVVLGMYCFWTGEKIFGSLKGVVGTEAGYMGRSEVVEVRYNPNEISEREIENFGKQNNCADKKFPGEFPSQNRGSQDLETQFNKDRESKYYLFHSVWAYVPMTATQACKANSLLGQGKDCSNIFSKEQRRWFTELTSKQREKGNIKFDKDIMKSWYSMK